MAKLKKRKDRAGGGGRSKKPKAAAGKPRDDFFEKNGDEELESEQEEGSERRDNGEEDDETEDEEEKESAEQKRLRIAKAYLDRIRKSVGTEEEEGDDEEKNLGNRDSLVADLLKQQQLEESGRAQRKLAARIVEPAEPVKGSYVSRRHRQSVTAVALTEDDSRGFAASKDGMIVHWDVESGKSDKYDWPSSEASTSGKNIRSQLKGKRGGKQQGSRHVLALAVSSDGRFLASGGLDRTVHVWDTRTREHVQAFPGHKGAVSSLAFRLGTQQLISGAFDRTIKLWSVEDRSYIDTLFGHQSEVVSVDCLRQERVLSAGRDRTLRLWKVPEESQLVFRGHAPSMESCCMISNGEFLSGSDDGSVALWSTLRKKPVFIVRNAHGSGWPEHSSTELSNSEMPVVEPSANGLPICQLDTSNGDQSLGAGGAAKSWVGAVAVSRGSDLAASGAGDGTVRLWAVEDGNKALRGLHGLPVEGFVNSLKLAYSGRFMLAGVGQEPRLGRWAHIQSVRNGVIMHSLDLTN